MMLGIYDTNDRARSLNSKASSLLEASCRHFILIGRSYGDRLLAKVVMHASSIIDLPKTLTAFYFEPKMVATNSLEGGWEL